MNSIVQSSQYASTTKSVGAPAYEFLVRDIVYQNVGGIDRLARLYQPAGNGPFPAVLQIHGGAWNNKDRTDGQSIALDLAANGIVVLSIDFRNAPEAPYPASLADINLGVRWLKANARQFGSSPDRVGALGTSSGGHQALLTAIRPNDPRYRALALSCSPEIDAKLAFVICGWGVMCPYDRYHLAKSRNLTNLIKSHETFFKDEAEQREATPHLIIERGEDVYLPPALQFQGTQDQFTSVEQAEHLAKV
ncbi:MAG: alpha/beta hydrolase, partial [Hyphomicrobiaceae bacterium]